MTQWIIPILSLVVYVVSQAQVPPSPSPLPPVKDSSGQINRKPAILHPPSEMPVGEQKHLYEFLGLKKSEKKDQ